MNNIKIVENLINSRIQLFDMISRGIIGQKDVIDHLFIALLCRGHILLEGVPGLAKTLLIKTLADALDLKFNRIQFTPDLMPSDITGTELIQQDKETGERSFSFHRGPLFSNIVLADEISPDTCRLWDVVSEKKLDKDSYCDPMGVRNCPTEENIK